MKKTLLLKTMLLLCALMVGSETMWGEKITDYTNIVSGTQYYIGATTGGNDYYLSVNGSSTSTSIAGTAVTSKASATVFTFEGSGTSWTIRFESGYYLSLKNVKDNGKVQVVENAATFTASNNSSKIRLAIGSYSIQKNNSGTQFGSYGNTQTDLWLEVAAPAYTITAQSNNNSFGTVSLNGSVITASPANGYTYASPAYTVSPENSATVAQEGNTFTVTPSANTTVTINFEAIPTHTATFSVNGVTTTQDFKEGAAIAFPEDPADVNDKTFVGWVTETIEGTTNDAPDFVTSATMGETDVTYYAVFADVDDDMQYNTLEITADTDGVPSSYGTANKFSECTLGGVKFQIQQMYKNGGKLQWRAAGNSNGTGTMYNDESLGKITSIVLTYNSSDGNKNFTLIVGNSKNPTSGTAIEPTKNNLEYTFNCSSANSDYFVLANGSNAGYLDKITINYAVGSLTITGYCTTVVADTKQDPELSFAVAEVNANISEQFEAPTLNTAAGFNGTVEYESSDETVAQIMDSETGELRLLKEGTTTITATFAGNDDFKAGSASYMLTVTDDRIATTISVEDIVLDIADIATLTQLNPVVKDANDNIIDCTYEDFPPKVSYEIVSDDNYIIGSLDNNSGEIFLNNVLGTATLKACYNAFNVNNTYKPSECTFTITVEKVMTISEVRAQGEGSVTTKGVVTSCSGITAYIQDANAAICVYGSALTVGDEVKVKGTLTTYNGLLEITSPTVTVLSQNNTMTPEVMTIYQINESLNQGWLVKIENAKVTAIDGLNTTIAQDGNTIVARGITADIAVNDIITLTGNIGCYKVAQIANPTDVTITAVTITLADACNDGEGNYYGTYSNASAFIVPDDLTVAEVGIDGNSKLIVETYETGDVVPANTGVMVSSATAGAHVVLLSTGGTSVLGNNNSLRATGNEGITADAMNTADNDCVFYRLTMHNGTDLGFYWGAEEGAAFAVAANKAYLAVPKSAGARIQGFSFVDVVTGISQIENGKLEAENYFDLQGRRVANPAKGLYIKNGKKVMVK